MPRKDGMQVAEEILAMSPKQRIIFASAYVEQTLNYSIKQLKQVVELMQKPFGAEALVNTIEDKEVYEGLKQIMLSMKQIKDTNPSPKQLKSLLESSRKSKKEKPSNTMKAMNQCTHASYCRCCACDRCSFGYLRPEDPYLLDIYGGDSALIFLLVQD